jgi:hypothetical protein
MPAAELQPLSLFHPASVHGAGVEDIMETYPTAQEGCIAPYRLSLHSFLPPVY